MRYTYLDSPLGELVLAGDDDGLAIVDWEHTRPAPDWEHVPDAFPEASAQLTAYFAGTLRDFDLALAPRGSRFQRAVWTALTHIPYGETTTYGAIAAEVGMLNGARAVGAANGQNPLPIIVPCHRVIGANGSLTGYGGGLPMKRFLLELEASHSGLFSLG
ncbi:MAG TPA: methylated-DNA--[protein]-cysteine S-methyltransferase [Pseudonocardiaceae bacterium]|jgi:methylated-DNA-[protein]-cysteine S-methyltransferase|nr:methylated-DNA--[protein]-cysteine S-methyltransferase [Pseudonocardiaceae bacterium]